MARSQKLEDTLAILRTVRNDLSTATAISTLQQVLKSKFSIAVAQAATLIGDAEIYELIPELVKAFERFMEKPETTDPGCKAKEYIAEALYKLEFSDERLFLQGIHHIQLEATWGTRVDTAAGLRGMCALGLVRMNYPDVMVELADLLTDGDPSARATAAKAIAYTANKEGIPLLRLKAQIGDDNPNVLSECFIGLLTLDPDQSLPFVARFLETHPDPACEMAVLALGESRLDTAFPILQTFWEQSNDRNLRSIGLMAIAMLRCDQAIDFLLSLITSGHHADARDALAALKMYRQEHRLWERVRQSIDQRGDESLHQVFNMSGQ
ncbi:MAG: HEAT repeat domain-containing protein [Cyanobacteria bacterium P01_A01_bin.37]